MQPKEVVWCQDDLQEKSGMMLRISLYLHPFWRTANPLKFVKSSVIAVSGLGAALNVKWAPYSICQQSLDRN